jgi:hypothetical protein
MIRCIKEIRTVGFIDWFWFVIYLRRDDCSDKLDIYKYYDRYGHNYLDPLMHDRDKAHRIDIKLRDIKVISKT